jgi:predicted O-methyltransferase YrrM
MQSALTKLSNLFSIMSTRPREFYGRVATMVEGRVDPYVRSGPSYEPIEWPTLLGQLSEHLGVNVEEVLREDELKRTEDQVMNGLETMPADAPFALYHNGDLVLGHLCYVLARIRRPSVIVETGVCYGVTSAFLLKAIQVNGNGVLHSIDLPPLGKAADDFVGRLVVPELRANWKLHRGRSQDLLPGIVHEKGPVDLFVHDSLHTYRNMRREFEIVTPNLAADGVLIADDVEGNCAFAEWVSHSSPAYSAVVRERVKRGLTGVALLHAIRVT